jgi:hypothetical protein
MRRKFFRAREREPQRGPETPRTSTETLDLQVMTLSGCAGKLHICSKKMRYFTISPGSAFHCVQNIYHRRRIRPVGSVPHSVCISLTLIPDHQCDHQTYNYGHPKPIRRRLQGYIKIVHDIPSLTYKHRHFGSLALASALGDLRIPSLPVLQIPDPHSPIQHGKSLADGDFYNSSRNSGTIGGNG